jgi:hypothetical protein
MSPILKFKQDRRRNGSANLSGSNVKSNPILQELTMDQSTNTKTEQGQYYRFQLFQKAEENAPTDKKKKVGMAYLKEGQSLYTLRLWTFLEDRFYLLPSKDDPAKYLLMTRELNRVPNPKTKYFWNVVGHGVADTASGSIAIRFDLFEKPVFMSIFPETTQFSAYLQETIELPSAA